MIDKAAAVTDVAARFLARNEDQTDCTMKITKYKKLAAVLSALNILALGSAPAETLRILAPAVLPRNQSLGAYSPFIAFSYSNLKSEPCTLKVWLLEEDAWNCASSQWCEKTFAIGNGHEAAADGTLRMTSPFDVYDYGPSLTWVARLFNGSGVEVASAKLKSKTVVADPPVLKPVGKRVGAVGQELRFVLSAVAPAGEKVTFRMHDAPAEAKLDGEAGVFTWTPSTPALCCIVVEAVSQKTKLADAEIVTLDIAQVDEAPAPEKQKPVGLQ